MSYEHLPRLEGKPKKTLDILVNDVGGRQEIMHSYTNWVRFSSEENIRIEHPPYKIVFDTWVIGGDLHTWHGHYISQARIPEVYTLLCQALGLPVPPELSQSVKAPVTPGSFASCQRCGFEYPYGGPQVCRGCQGMIEVFGGK